MSVRNNGSKLAQGVRQIKAQQDGSPPVAAPDSSLVPAAVKVASPRAAVKVAAAKPAPVKAVTPAIPVPAKDESLTKPAPAKVNESGLQHPERVWPD